MFFLKKLRFKYQQLQKVRKLEKLYNEKHTALRESQVVQAQLLILTRTLMNKTWTYHHANKFATLSDEMTALKTIENASSSGDLLVALTSADKNIRELAQLRLEIFNETNKKI